MVICAFCQRKETRNRPFATPYTCTECESKEENYNHINDADEIIFIDSKGKHVNITNETEVEIETIPAIDTSNYKDSQIFTIKWSF